MYGIYADHLYNPRNAWYHWDFYYIQSLGNSHSNVSSPVIIPLFTVLLSKLHIEGCNIAKGDNVVYKK